MTGWVAYWRFIGVAHMSDLYAWDVLIWTALPAGVGKELCLLWEAHFS
jgi:hypothetical protein